MSEKIIAMDTYDVRFPTSLHLDGSDAMNRDPDYSAAYVVIRTDGPLAGHGFAFTTGRGTDVQVAAVDALAPLVLGWSVDDVLSDMGAFWRRLTGDAQLRWLGPDKGIMQMAIAAVVNAMWDLYANRVGKPLWKVLADFPPDELVRLVDFRYISDALPKGEALDILAAAQDGRADRERLLRESGFPAYTTSPGWLGYSEEKLARLCRDAVDAGFDHIKLKVGTDITQDMRRCGIARGTAGWGVQLSIDANQRWGVAEAIENIRRLMPYQLTWVEEPTHPDDVLGHRAIARAIEPVVVAAGEHVPNRVIFKQLLSSGGIGACQIDACRVSGVNENLAIILLAAKFGVPVCPHAGGVGLCEVVQHLAMFDFVAVSGRLDGRRIEYVDHLHEHFVDPVVIRDGRYRAPQTAGSGARIRPESLADYAYPTGAVWATLLR